MVTSPPADAADAADLALALRLAVDADLRTTAAFRSADLVVETKPDLTPVTEADRAVEAALRRVLEVERPGDAVVGEEHGTTGTGTRRWIIDPIDGTKNFVRGIPVWATLIALEVDGRVQVGVVSAPALHRRWWAASGHGAFAAPLEGGAPGEATPCRVSAVADLADAQVSAGSLGGWDEAAGARLDGYLALVRACWRDRSLGDFWSHALVAEGACDIGIDPVASLWDMAAVQILVEEAGGRFTDLAGRPTAGGGSGVSTNGLLHDATLDLLRG
ncbi:MAG TPA: inositol monophosphatase family protein [Acidimicrobiales bacterium]|nr:inositol monophosphatase family protein [Acidimicrobiales bacterium]